MPKALGAIKYLLVAVDYLTKWIEARPLREISASEVERFTWKHLICRYGLHYAIVIDNSTQFKAYTYEEFLTRLGVKHLVTSIEHPQTNDQAKAANKVILRTLCIRPDKSKGLWKEELPSILWAYHCSPQTTINETPCCLTYGTDAMILVKVRELSTRRFFF